MFLKTISLFLVSVLLLFNLSCFSDEEEEEGVSDGELEITVMYTGSESVGTDHFVHTALYSNSNLTGTEEIGYGFSFSTYEITYEDLTGSEYYIIAFYDKDGNGSISSGDSYEIYQEKTTAELPATAVETGSDIEISFDDTNIY